MPDLGNVGEVLGLIAHETRAGVGIPLPTPGQEGQELGLIAHEVRAGIGLPLPASEQAGETAWILPHAASGSLYSGRWVNASLLTGGTPGARVAVFWQGIFDSYRAISSSGTLTLYDLQDGIWQASECQDTARAWTITVTGTSAVVLALTAAAYPTVPVGARLLVIKDGKFAAVNV